MTFLKSSAYFAVLVTLGSWLLGVRLAKKTGSALVNPILFSVACTVALLLLLKIPYEDYKEKSSFISWLLTPATVCLALPLYEQMKVLKKQWKAVLGGILAGACASLLSVLLLCRLFGLTAADTATLLPKSVTTAISMEISSELGGIPSVTAAVVILTGILGNILAPFLCRLLRLTDPVARGIAIGSSSHAIGTAKALEMGEIEGAMSGLSIAVSGLITVVLAPLAMMLV